MQQNTPTSMPSSSAVSAVSLVTEEQSHGHIYSDDLNKNQFQVCFNFMKNKRLNGYSTYGFQSIMLFKFPNILSSNSFSTHLLFSELFQESPISILNCLKYRLFFCNVRTICILCSIIIFFPRSTYCTTYTSNNALTNLCVQHQDRAKLLVP